MYTALHTSHAVMWSTEWIFVAGRWCDLLQYLQGSEWHVIIFLIKKNMTQYGFNHEVTFMLADTEKKRKEEKGNNCILSKMTVRFF